MEKSKISEKSENAIKWIEGLKSGKYKQAKYKLGDLDTGMCCWGLGCHLTNFDYIPEHTWNWVLYEKIGYKYNGGTFKSNGECPYTDLVDLNDVGGYNFEEIGNLLIKYAHLNFDVEVACDINNHFNNHKTTTS